ncbi:MAG: hypothetical protein EOP48_30765 [Sphingobacteriales bacterium]|nr:MAG: hypothetical protein EOP48_30765 [Sphingobacteriales bacterium]
MAKDRLQEDLNSIGKEMVQYFLEKRGCLVESLDKTGIVNLIEVVSPARTEKATALIYTVQSGTEPIDICIATMDNKGEKRPLLVDYHLVKICGGNLYSVPDPVIQDIMLKEQYERLYTGNDRSFYVVCNRQLLLDRAMKIEERIGESFRPLKHVRAVKPVQYFQLRSNQANVPVLS